MNLKGFSGELNYAIDGILKYREKILSALAPAERDELKALMDEDIPESISFIESSVSRMDKLISAVLVLSRCGRRELHIEQVEAAAVVKEILKSIHHQIEKGRVAFRVDDLHAVYADMLAFEQVMANIIQNAVLYLHPARPGRIRIWSEKAGGETVFHVRDNGRHFQRGSRQDFSGIPAWRASGRTW